MQNLKAILGGKQMSLRGTGNSGVGYTTAEHKLALLCLVPLLALASVPHENKDKDGKAHTVPKDVEEAVGVAAQSATENGSPSISGIAKSAFRALVTAKIGDKKEAKGNAEYPKHRDATSINLIFRKACEQLKVNKASIDEMFPRYVAKAKQA